MNGFLLVHKPTGMTSHDVVDAARAALGEKRIGHAGTLDPMAEGLLILGVGSATKELTNLLGLEKSYDAEITLGATSDTDDTLGTLTQCAISTPPARDDVQRALEQFRGEILQTPPLYSAKKIRGVPAHRRMRRGEDVTLTPKTVTVHQLILHTYEYPLLSLSATVSSGTYIRALARDIGNILGTGAYLSKLVRTSMGKHRLSDALPISAISTNHIRPREVFE